VARSASLSHSHILHLSFTVHSIKSLITTSACYIRPRDFWSEALIATTTISWSPKVRANNRRMPSWLRTELGVWEWCASTHTFFFFFFNCTYYGRIYFALWAEQSLFPSIAVLSLASSLLGSVCGGCHSIIGIWARNRQYGYPPLLKVHEPLISLNCNTPSTVVCRPPREKQYNELLQTHLTLLHSVLICLLGPTTCLNHGK
jgi:hypothetical protein